jgi:hypothetical protein
VGFFNFSYPFDIEHIQILGDSKIVIDWLNNKGTLQVSSLLGWLDQVLGLNHIFIFISFAHIYREENEEANSFSKKMLHFLEGKIH